MCTVSWVHEDRGYQLLCNRDEKKIRKPALAPEVFSHDGVRYVAPRDGDHGGTWLASNERGLTLCLLNGQGQIRHTPLRSRGLLLPDLILARSRWQVADLLMARDLSAYAPFTLVAIEPHQPALIVEWDGLEQCIRADGDKLAPLVSSSFDLEGVKQSRLSEFQRLVERGNVEQLFSFHESHGTRPDAYSTCMHRGDAETVSFSWVRVSDKEIDFFYTPGSPCQRKSGERVLLQRSN